MSTESTVLDSSDHILGNFNRGKYTVAFLDLSRALEWFVSYFSQRKHIVNMLDVSSPMILSDISTAQGSCPGPLMLTVYMNDIVRCSPELNIQIYADDTTLHVSGVRIGQCISLMNQGFSHVYRCLYMNKFSLNVSKPRYAIFNRGDQINLNVLPSITLNNSALERNETVTFLECISMKG